MRIDLNADLGEECGDDAAIFRCVSSANIACGAHAGSAHSIEASLALAAELSVTVGAHVSYEDRERFGRVALEVPEGELTASIAEQIERLQAAAAGHGLVVRYVKPHGALYHEVGRSSAAARALVAAVQRTDPSMHLLVPATSVMHGEARGLTCVQEFFADRGYHDGGRLVARSDARAHVHDVEEIAARTLDWLSSGEVTSVEGERVRVDASSICLHGDSAAAVAAARRLRSEISTAGYRITNWMLP